MKIIRRIYYLITFALFYLTKLVQANISIAWDILTPDLKTQPAFISIEMNLPSDNAVLLFSNLVSMTPGTLSANINEEKTSMYVHVLYAQQEDTIRKELIDIQERIKKLSS